MITKKCDICGCLEEKYKNEVFSFRKVKSSFHMYVISFDICENCIGEIQKQRLEKDGEEDGRENIEK